MSVKLKVHGLAAGAIAVEWVVALVAMFFDRYEVAQAALLTAILMAILTRD